MLRGQTEAGSVTAFQKLILIVLSAVPYRSRRMDHILGRQPVALCDFGLPRFAPVQGPALLQKLRTRCPVNGPVDPAPAEKGGVGRIADGIGLNLCDIPFDDFDSQGSHLRYKLLA
ncbi:hypothetical protein SDC9_186896 [bioreactor metagenome]|uniref:Uncharacterized protein n=1 Tax=bioreactor metagenome TaxID=1076179 RepID=A0A645HK20_9ZZZZ